MQVIHVHSQAISELAFAQCVVEDRVQLVLASAGDDKRGGFWLLAEQAQERWHVPLAHEQQEALLAIGLRADGQRMTSVDSNGHVFLWDVHVRAHATLVHHFATQPTRLRLVAFSADGQSVAIGHRDGTVQLWQVETGAVTLVLTGTTGSIIAVALSPDGRLLATGGKEGHLCLWKLPAGQLQQVVETKAGAIDALAFCPDGQRLASAHLDHAVRVWAIDAAAGLHLRHTLTGHTHVIWSVAFGPPPTLSQTGNRAAAQQLIVSGSDDCTVCLWTVADGALRAILRGHTETIHKVTFSPDGALVLSCSFDGTIKFWDSQTGACLNTLQVEGPYAGMNITGVTGITAAQKAALQVLGAVV